jgi:hypothetical protein
MIVFLLALAMQTAQAPSWKEVGPWRHRETVDPVTDARTASFVIGDNADNLVIGCRIGSPNTLTVYWRGNRSFRNNIDMALRGALTYRFDTDEPQTVATVLWSAKQSMHFYDSADAFALLRRLPTSTRLVLRDGNSSARTVVFSYSSDEMVEISQRIDAACGTALTSPAR